MANIFTVFRHPFTFLIAIVLSIGPSYFQRVHESQVNQALARIAPPKVVGHTPLKKLPVQSPTHDPASCPICVALHAPMDGHFAAMPSVQPVDRIGSASASIPQSFHTITIATDRCRGPPMA
jgi:hypothetical protein